LVLLGRLIFFVSEKALENEARSLLEISQERLAFADHTTRPPLLPTQHPRPQVASQPELFWLDALGALQNVSFGAHGLASRFALSLLDNGFREGMSLDEARELMEKCFRQLERRYLVSSVGFPMKVVDRDGCRDVACEGRGKEGHGGGGGGRGGADSIIVEQPAGGRKVAAPPVVARGGAKTASIS